MALVTHMVFIVLIVFNWDASVCGQNTIPQTIATNLRSFTVPFTIDNQQGHYIEVQLFVSEDRGETWKYHSRQNVNGKGFPFSCDDEGEYWFAIKSLDRNRRLVPAGNVTNPELVIIVDSQKPEVQFTIESDAAGRIISQWDVRDQYLGTGSLLLKHRGIAPSGEAEDWQPIEIAAPDDVSDQKRLYDQVAWWPKTRAQRIEVQLVVTDSAGNFETVSRTISLPAAQRRNDFNSTTRHQNSATAKDNLPQTSSKPDNGKWVCKDGVCKLAENPIPATPKINQQKPPVHQVGSTVEYVAPPAPLDNNPLPKGLVKAHSKNDRQSARKNSADSPAPAPESVQWESSSSQWTGKTQQSQASTADLNHFPKPVNKQPVLGVQERYGDVPVVKERPAQEPKGWQRNSSYSRGNLVISESTTSNPGSPSRDAWTAPINPSQPETKTPPSQFVSNPKTETPFPQVSKVSTTENGIGNRATSEDLPLMYLNTRRFNLNYGIKAIDTSGVGKVILWATEDNGESWKSWSTDPDNASPFPVEVPNEGLYGFKVVIHSKDGLIGKPPASGDTPDIVVHVDLSTPRVKLTSAPYGSGRDVGKLIINWQADDSNLTQRPIELFYSPNIDGPWTTIAKRLRNSGSFAWKVPKHVPENLFLRIDARDSAGNIGVFQLTAPLDISGLVPRGQILGVEPIK